MNLQWDIGKSGYYCIYEFFWVTGLFMLVFLVLLVFWV